MIKKLKMRFVLVNMLILTFVLVSILSSIYFMMKQSEINVSNQIMDTLIENHRKNEPDHERNRRPADKSPDSKREIQAKLTSVHNQELRLVKLADFEEQSDEPQKPQNEVQPWPFWENSFSSPEDNGMWGNWGNFGWNWWEDPNNQWGGNQNQNPPQNNSQNDSGEQNQGDSQQNQWGGGDPWAGWGDPNQWGGNQGGNGDPNSQWGGGDPWAGWGDPNQWGGNQDGNGDPNSQWGGDPWAGWGDYNPYENPPWPGWPAWPPAEESSSPQESQSSAPETNPAPSYAPEAGPSYIPETSPVPDETVPEETEAQKEETSKAPAEASKAPPKPSEVPPPEKYDGNLVRSHIIADVDGNGKLMDLSLKYFLRYDDDTIEDEESFTEKVKFKVNNIVSSSNTTGKCTVDNVSFRYKLDSSGPENMQTLILLDRSIEISTLDRFMFIFIIIGCAGFVVVLAVSILLASWAIKPIEVAWNRQKQFIADASHELKTPLTVIATNTDVVLSTPNDLIRNQERWLQYIKSETSRMTKLVTELLYIAKSDSNEIRMDMHDFDVSNVVSGVCLNFEAHAFEEQRELAADISPRLKYFGDEDRIKQLVTILIDNAIKYSIIGSQISVSLFRNNQNRIKLCVSNRCENLTEENISKLFDRFYRVDSSRNSGTGGNGLGLNIAQAIVEAHNGLINVNYNHGIISFTVTL